MNHEIGRGTRCYRCSRRCTYSEHSIVSSCKADTANVERSGTCVMNDKCSVSSCTCYSSEIGEVCCNGRIVAICYTIIVSFNFYIRKCSCTIGKDIIGFGDPVGGIAAQCKIIQCAIERGCSTIVCIINSSGNACIVTFAGPLVEIVPCKQPGLIATDIALIAVLNFKIASYRFPYPHLVNTPPEKVGAVE